MSQTLAEARADLRALQEDPGVTLASPDHAAICSHEPRCWSKAEVDADIRRRQRLIAAWFGPGRDQQSLWEINAAQQA